MYIDPLADAQVLNMLVGFFREIGLMEPQLQINSLGCPDCRPVYRSVLLAFLENRLDQLCEDCRRRFSTNPLRILDCKVPRCSEATAGAPSVFWTTCAPVAMNTLPASGAIWSPLAPPYAINPRMVRGLDYYTRTTFEMVTGLLGSQSAVAAGGRYDGLISQLGGPSIPGIGFAMGLERVALLLGDQDILRRPDLFIATLGGGERSFAFQLMHELLQLGVRVEMDYEGKSLKSQMRRADKLEARYSMVIGENEVTSGKAAVKRMEDGNLSDVPLAAEAISRVIG